MQEVKVDNDVQIEEKNKAEEAARSRLKMLVYSNGKDLDYIMKLIPFKAVRNFLMCYDLKEKGMSIRDVQKKFDATGVCKICKDWTFKKPFA